MRRSSSTSSTTSSTMAPQRASWISVTFLRQPNVDGATLLWDCAGVDLCLNRCQGQVMVMSVKEDCTSTRHLQVGDVLDSINGRSCHNVEITDVWGMVDGSIEIAAPEEEEETVVTTEDTETTNETPEQGNTNTDETTTTPNEVASEPADNADESDNKSVDNGLITLTFHCAEGCSGMVCAVAIPPSDGTTSSTSSSDYPPFSLGLTLTEQEDQPPRRRLRRTVSTTKSLVITEIIKDRWMAQSALNLGDSLLSVNDNVTNGCSLDEVVALISKEISANNTITILAKPGADSNNNNNNQRGARWQKVRRASAKVGGGLMVTTGAVLMVTPLHPVGHAMAIGGVAVLGGLGRKKKKQEEGDDNDKVGDAIDEKATDDDDSSSQEAEADKDGTPDTPRDEQPTKEKADQDTPAAPRKIIVEAV